MKNHLTKRLMLMTSILVMLFLGSCDDGSPVKEGHVEAEHKHHLRVDAKWLYAMENKETRLLYEWSKHEIDLHEIYDFAINGDGTIGLAYADHYGLNIPQRLWNSSILLLRIRR